MRSARERGHEGPCAAVQDDRLTVTFTLTGSEPFGLLAAARWLKDGLHLFINDGPTRRAVDKLYEAAETAVQEKRDAVAINEPEPEAGADYLPHHLR